MSAPVMSMFANELDCLRARDKYHTDRIAELEAELRQSREAEGAWRIEHARIESKNMGLEQEVARLTTHIRAIAEHHDQYSHTTLDWKVVPAWTNYHTERRDFALSGLEGK